MKTDYASLRSQVRNFSEFYGAAISEAKKQVCGALRTMFNKFAYLTKSKGFMMEGFWVLFFFFCLLMLQISAAISEMSEANKDLLEKYRKEVALRRKYHEQLVELKGITLKGSNWPHQVKSASLSELPVCRQHSRAVSREASAKGGPARRGPLGGRDDGPQQRVLALGAEQRKGSHLWNGQNLPPTVHTGRGNKDDTCKGSIIVQQEDR